MLYTIHHKPGSGNNPHALFGFTMDNDNDNELRSYAAVFHSEGHASFMAHRIEMHKRQRKKWPAVTFRDAPMIDLSGSTGRSMQMSRMTLKDLYIEPWTNDDIQDLCYHYNMGILLFDVEVHHEDHFGLHIEQVDVQSTPSYHRMRLHKMMQL